MVVELMDNAMNSIYLSKDGLAIRGFFQNTIEVRKVAQLLNFTALGPTKVDVSQFAVFVEYVLEVKSTVLQTAWLSASISGFPGFSTAITPSAVEPGVQTVFLTVEVPQMFRPGLYRLSLTFVDMEGFGTFVYEEELAARGLPFQIEVINDDFEYDPPELLNFTVQPFTVFNRTATSRVATVTVTARDKTGTREISLRAIGPYYIEKTSDWTKPIVGVSTYSFVIDFGEFYQRTRQSYNFEVTLTDANGFDVYIPDAELVKRGFTANVTLV